MLDELKIVAYLNQAWVSAEEYLSSESQYDIYYTNMSRMFLKLVKNRCFYQSC